MARLFALLSCAVLAFAAFPLLGVAEAGEELAIAGPVMAEVIKVRDGDTIEVEAHIWPLQTVHVAVRLRGIDAPELKAKCEAERRAALVARDRLTELVGGGDLALHDVAGDKYFGRVLAYVSASGEADVGRRLLDEGLVAAYDGGKRRNWCDGDAKLTSLTP